MRLLLDTHALLWWLKDEPRLGGPARALIADTGNDVLVSAVSLWEIVVKVRIGKLVANVAEIAAILERDGFKLLAIRPAHLATLQALPTPADHRDPFDHLLIAQALTEKAVFMSDDRRMSRYSLPVVTCSQGEPDLVELPGK